MKSKFFPEVSLVMGILALLICFSMGNQVSNNILSIAYFDGNWFIGTGKELVMLKKSPE